MPQRAYACHLRGGFEAQTFFAATASKARYMALLEWSDCMPGLSFRDIVVTSLGVIETPQEIAERQASEWNAAHGPGTPIRVYPLLNGDEETGYDTVAREPGAYVMGGNRVSVKVPGDCIALSHVRVRASAQGGGR